MDGLDAEVHRIPGRADRNLSAAYKDVATIDRENTRDRLDQRRFSGAIVAQQRHHLAFPQCQRGVLQRAHAAEGFLQALQPKYFLHHSQPLAAFFCSKACRMSMARMMRPTKM